MHLYEWFLNASSHQLATAGVTATTDQSFAYAVAFAIVPIFKPATPVVRDLGVAAFQILQYWKGC